MHLHDCVNKHLLTILPHTASLQDSTFCRFITIIIAKIVKVNHFNIAILEEKLIFEKYVVFNNSKHTTSEETEVTYANEIVH